MAFSRALFKRSSAVMLRAKLIRQARYFFQTPKVIGNPRLHSGAYTQRLVLPGEIVMHEMQRYSMRMILNLFSKCVC